MELKSTVALIKPFVSGFVGAAIFILSYSIFHTSVPHLGTVNINGLVNEHIKQRANTPLSEKELQSDSRQFMDKLEGSLQDLAKQQHLYLIVSDAVIAGAKDYTDNIRRSVEVVP